jgi:hypothetical protein
MDAVASSTSATHTKWTANRRAFTRKITLWGTAILALLIISRAALAPRYLVTFDEVNFALSIKHFNPLLHQPQPPGYPLFVGLLRVCAVLVTNVEHLFLLVALIGSALSLFLIWAVGDRLLDRGMGLAAALLLLFHPSFWYAALTNPVRVFLAAGALGVVFCLVRAFTGSRSVRWFYLAAAVFGIATGFRPDLLFTLAPLVVYGGWKMRLNIKEATLAAALLVLGISSWLFAAAFPVGGLLPYIGLLRAYGSQQGGSTSVLLGAPLQSAVHMAYTTTVWTFTGALSWAWCVPFLFYRKRRIFTATQGQILSIWLAGGFLFYALVHTGDPDHTLSIVPVTCLAGAVVLRDFARYYIPKFVPFVIGGAVVINVLLFLRPIGKTAEAASYRMVVSLDEYMQDVIDSIAALRSRGPVTVVAPAFVSGWRTVSYYFPDVPVLTVDSENPQQPTGRQWYRGGVSGFPVNAGAFILPGCGTIAWIDTTARPVSNASGETVSAMPGSPVTYLESKPGASYTFRKFRFRAKSQGCTPANPDARSN